MKQNRRGFMGLILAGCVAPAIVSSTSLMKIAPPKLKLLHVDLTVFVTGYGPYDQALARQQRKRILYGSLYGRPIEVPGLDVVSIKRISIVDATFLESPARFFDVYKELNVRSQ